MKQPYQAVLGKVHLRRVSGTRVRVVSHLEMRIEAVRRSGLDLERRVMLYERLVEEFGWQATVRARGKDVAFQCLQIRLIDLNTTKNVG